MPGRSWRETAPTVAAVALALALVAVSFAPWYGLSVGGLLDISQRPQVDAWHVSGLWVLAVGLGAGAGAAVALRQRSWLIVAGLALIGVLLVVLPPGGPLCACGAPAEQGFGWFAFDGAEKPAISFGSRWGRWVAAALLLLQLVVAATQLRSRSKENR